jgi:lipoprotein LprG
MRNRLSALLTLLCTLALLILPTACSGGGGGDNKGDGTPADVLAAAKHSLDETSGVHIVLSTDKLAPKNGVLKADGIGTHQPAFEGSIDVVAAGFKATVPVVAVNGVVYATLPFTKKYVDIEPGDYSAPDPAVLMDPDKGLSTWLTKASGATKGDQERDGSDILTTYTAKVPGDVVAQTIPSADDSATFSAKFAVDNDGLLRSAEVTGPFYKGSDSMTYTVAFSDYDTKKTVETPAGVS